MKNKISLKRTIQITILFLTFLAIFVVWPLKLIRPWQYMGEVNKDSQCIVPGDTTILQQFIPVNDYLRSISFYIYNEDIDESQNASAYIRLFDANLNRIERVNIKLTRDNTPGLITIPIRGEWKAGEVYYFSIESRNTEILVSMEDGVNIDVLYGYRVFYTRKQYLMIGVSILCIGLLLILLTEMLFRRRYVKVNIDMLWHLPAAALVVAGSIFAAYNVFPAKKLATETVDIIFYEVGILLFLTFSLYCLLRKRPKTEERKITFEECAAKLPGVLQSVCFAGVMLGCVRYLNALSSYDQKTASNLTLACFALAVLCSFTKKEIFNVYQPVYVVVATGVSIWYCIQHAVDEESLVVARGTAVAYSLWGMIALNVIHNLIINIKNKRKLWKEISPVYSIMLLLLLAEFVRSRNGKEWPIVLLVLCALFAFRVIDKRSSRETYLKNFVNGVFIHFIGISIYAWLHRPFHFYTHTRYPGVFHTVTAAAVYDCFVMVLALAVFLVKYAKNRKLSQCLKEIWIFGLSAGFMLLTASRTGLFASGILCILLLVVTMFTEFKDGILKLLLRIGLLLVIVVGFFISTFTACRIIPAVYNKPQTFEIELFFDSIKEGEEWDSFRYITVRKFLAVFDAKLSYYDKGQKDTAIQAEEVQENNNTYASPELTEEKEGIGGNLDYTNGRMDIYKKYLSLLDWKGHKDVAIPGDDGKMIAHAHNAYIQVAYDFGIGAGIYFLIFCVVFAIRSILYYAKHRGEKAGIIPVAVIGTFGVCGLVEWVMLPYIPTGFALFFVLVLLMPKIKETQSL